MSTDHPPAVLQARALGVQRGAARVLHGVDLDVHAGQWLAIVGPNGAGKSSLLQALSGWWPCATGEVRLMGRPLGQWPAPRRARTLAWMGQSPALSEGEGEALSVDDTVGLGRLPHQGWWDWPARSAADREAIAQALRDADMLALRDRPLQALSGGERQRAHLARALATQAPVLLLDEPASHLDAPHQRLLAGVLRGQAQRGHAVVSVLHELSLALAADRIAVLQSGRLLACGPADDAQVHRAIEAVFDHAVRIARVDDRWTAVPCF